MFLQIKNKQKTRLISESRILRLHKIMYGAKHNRNPYLVTSSTNTDAKLKASLMSIILCL